MLFLSALFIYPLKSTRGLSLETASVEERGLQHDRRWMLVDERGRFLSQRDHPRLAMIHTQVQATHLTIQAPGLSPLLVPFPDENASRLSVTVWNDCVPVAAADAEADAWFRQYLGQSCRLVFMPADSKRPVDPAYAVGDNHVSLADGYPILLTTEASLADLNHRLEVAVPMNRFRPNLVVAGTNPFEEDQWKQVQIGEVLFHAVKPCARCIVTTVDQGSAVQGKEPLRTLATYRKKDNKVYFGQNLVPDGTGILQVGDEVQVLASM